MRLISAAPRDVAAKRRSIATTLGRRLCIASSASSASVSVKVRTSWLPIAGRSRSAGNRSDGPIRTVHDSATEEGIPGFLEDAGVLDGPPPDLHLADDVLLRHEAPVTA